MEEEYRRVLALLTVKRQWVPELRERTDMQRTEMGFVGGEPYGSTLGGLDHLMVAVCLVSLLYRNAG